MDSRTVYTKVWRDEWFGALSRTGKLLFLYCITNTAMNQTGIYDLPDRVISFETGLSSKELEETKIELHGKVQFYKGWIKVVNTARYSNFKGGANVIAQEKELKRVPKNILENLDGLDTLPTPSIDSPESLNLIKSNLIKSNQEEKNKTQSEADEVTKVYNQLFERKKTVSNPWIKNFKTWREVYTLDEILGAIRNWKDGGWLWTVKDEPDLTTFFRTSNKLGDCDYIGQFLNRHPSKSKEPMGEDEYLSANGERRKKNEI